MNFQLIERKWQEYWDKNKSFKVTEDPKYPKEKRAYLLDMFPYPSGNGLHVGHPEGYTATDIFGRYLRMKGYNVLHPMGYDSFGLPAEQYAIQTGTHPSISTEQNIKNFERQIKSLGFAYDWDRKICTHDAEYYRWTQFVFLKLFEKGLAYESDMPVNWCEETCTVLANEEVIDGKCERTGFPVVKKNLRQWVLKITAYADRLLSDLDLCDWPESIKLLQKNWIGRSEGAEIVFEEDQSKSPIVVYTTRPDTLYGASYMVLAPGHPLVYQITKSEQKQLVQEYIVQTQSKNDMERTELNRDKTGVFTGAFAINPINNKKIPIWIGDYVLETYGTGAVMAVPAHDERDYEFARKYQLPMEAVVSPDGTQLPDLSEKAFVSYGISINSEDLSMLSTEDMKLAVIKKLGHKACAKVQYKLRDWIFSRQRFWGEPIPLVHCGSCGVVPLSEQDLPLLLPDVQSFVPTLTGESPLAEVQEWVNTTCPRCGGQAKRETNTMPQWAGSCWYYLRYIDPNNTQEFIAKEKEEYWMPVNLYVGGQEHAVLHLLYARFWHKVLYDCGLVSTSEPFLKLVNQGMILGENNEKMSKSRGNVVNPDDIVEEFGADSLRLYEMFMGPLEMSKPWSMNGIKGIKKFLDRVWRLFEDHVIVDTPIPNDLLYLTHKTIKKVSHDIETISQFNTAISALMILVNDLTGRNELPRECLEILAKLIAPFAPHLAEELWEMLGYPPLIADEPFPEYNEKLTIDQEIEFVIQINGKTKEKIIVPVDLPKEELERLGLDVIKEKIIDKTIIKCIVVSNKLLNVVVK
ncbi:MAG: leucine--tRNA ligase [Brevinema sp.]